MMTDWERQVLQKLHGGVPEAGIIIHQLHLLPFESKGRVFLYMIQKGIVGQAIVDEFHACKSSAALMYSLIWRRMVGPIGHRLPLIKKENAHVNNRTR